MSTQLILLCCSYPFGRDEPYIEAEIDFLAGQFDRIRIYSMAADSNESLPMPGNAEASRLPPPSKAGFIWLLKALLKANVFAECGLILRSVSRGDLIYRFKAMLDYLRQAESFAARIPIDEPDRTVIYAYWSDQLAVAAALLKADNPRTRMLCRAHGYDLYPERQRADYLPFRSLIHRTADELHYISRNGMDFINAKYPGTKGKSKLSRLGSFNEGPARDVLIGPEEAFTIFSCAYLVPLKRIQLIIGALAGWDGPPIRWVHAGSGPLEAELKTEAAERLTSPQLEFEFLGFVPNPEVLEFYRQNDVHLFINCSTTEGLPVSLMEAMSFGVPCLATDVGGTSEIVNERNGRLLDPQLTADELRSAIREFREMNQAEYDRYRQSARKSWEAEFDARSNYRLFAEGLSRLAG